MVTVRTKKFWYISDVILCFLFHWFANLTLPTCLTGSRDTVTCQRSHPVCLKSSSVCLGFQYLSGGRNSVIAYLSFPSLVVFPSDPNHKQQNTATGRTKSNPERLHKGSLGVIPCDLTPTNSDKQSGAFSLRQKVIPWDLQRDGDDSGAATKLYPHQCHLILSFSAK